MKTIETEEQNVNNNSKKNDKTYNTLTTYERNNYKTKEEESSNKEKSKIPILKIIIISSICLVVIAIIITLCVVLTKKDDDDNENINNENINTEEITIEEVNSVVGGQTLENRKMISESLNNIEDFINTIENSNSQEINKIEYNSNNLKIPSFLTNSDSDPDSHKISIAKKDIDLYNEKYKELSEKTNEYTENTSESMKEVSSPANNLKDEIGQISNQFDEAMKSLSLPLILEQKGYIKSNLRRLDEKIEDYKNKISQLNSLYNKFFKHIKQVIDSINKDAIEIPNSVIGLNNYINEGISNFTNLVEKMDRDNLHNNLITMKDSFLKLKENLNERKNKMEENINNFKKIDQKNKNDFNKFQSDFNELIKNLIESSNLIVEEVKKENKIQIKNKNPSDLIADSILNSITKTYEIIIKVHLQSKNKIETITIIINVESKTSLDLLFIMDLTGSMGSYIEEAKKNLIDIMNKIIEQSPGIDINLGFIGYSDIPEEGGGPYIDIDFTQNHTDLRNKINELYAYGGGDIPEDVAWAFEKALNKTWKSNAKFIVFVADAPGHGLKYAPNDYTYPDGIEGRKDIEESVEELAENNVSMFCLKISYETQVMFNIFENVYNQYNSTKFEIVDNNYNFSEEVVKSAIEIYSDYRETESN
jgi:hypothetical protein